MGSIQSDEMPPTVWKLPTVKLDTTLIDLYRLASPSHAHARLGMVLGLVNSGIDLTPSYPRSTKFLYQDSAFINVPRNKLTKNNPQLRKDLTICQLNLMGQRDAFIAGRTPAIMFHRGQTQSQRQHDRRQAEETFSVLDPSERPELLFCSGPSELRTLLNQQNIHHLTCKLASDELAEQYYPRYLLYNPEIHWYLNSKAALATSGLPTPQTTVLDLDPSNPPSPQDCCPTCLKSSQDAIKDSQIPCIPADCNGPRREWCHLQRTKILMAIRQREVPFVVKTQQTFGGAGTWVITSQEQKDKLLEDFYPGSLACGSDSHARESNGFLDKLLSQVTRRNAHLKPGAVLISEFIDSPVNNYGITFVITSTTEDTEGGEEISGERNRVGGKGESKAMFLAVSEQIICQESGAWLGSTIDYARQGYLQEKFRELIDQTAEWIVRTNTSGFPGQREGKGTGEGGYFGPVAIDVLETHVSPSPPPSSSSSPSSPGKSITNGHAKVEEGEKPASNFYIVDVNARSSGSLALPLLKNHFTARGLNLASSMAIKFCGGREEFLQRWRWEFEEGRMLILAWYEDYGKEEEAEEDRGQGQERSVQGGNGELEGNNMRSRDGDVDGHLQKRNGVKGGKREEVVWSYGDVVIGGEGRKELMDLLNRVRACSEEVTF